MKDVGGEGFAGSSPPFLGRELAAVDVDVGPERRSPRYHETCLAKVEGFFFCIPAKFDNLITMSTQGTRWIATTILGSGAFALYCGLDRFAPNITEMLVWREQLDRLKMLVGCA